MDLIFLALLLKIYRLNKTCFIPVVNLLSLPVINRGHTRAHWAPLLITHLYSPGYLGRWFRNVCWVTYCRIISFIKFSMDFLARVHATSVNLVPSAQTLKLLAAGGFSLQSSWTWQKFSPTGWTPCPWNGSLFIWQADCRRSSSIERLHMSRLLLV